MPAQSNKTLFQSIPFWRSAPMVVLCIPLMLGIVIGYYINLNYTLPVSIAIVLCFVSLLIVQYIKVSYKLRWLWGLLCQTIMLGLGMLLIWNNTQVHSPQFFGKIYTPNSLVQATLQEFPVAKEKSYKALVSLQVIDSNSVVQSTFGQAILYIQKDSLSSTLQYGSQLILAHPPDSIVNAGNPGAFKYADFANRQGIYYQAFLKSTDYYKLPTRQYNVVKAGLYSVRNSLLHFLQQSFASNPKAMGLAQALLAGYRGDLDKEMVEQFANAGVVHIIAISGLHLGLIFVLLTRLFNPIKKYKKLAWLHPVLVLAVLWFFCMLTGAAPSAVRAATMFSILQLGQIVQGRYNIINALAFAAFFQLVIDPCSLWNVGFQMSYTAVLSIAIFYKSIAAKLYSTHNILHAIGQLLAVTTAAQILTFPLGLYHFHQLPVYFLLTNLVAVPLATILLYSLVLLVALWPIAALASLVAKVIIVLMQLLIGYIAWCNTLPGITLNSVYLTMPQLVCFYIVIGLLGRYLLAKKPKVLPWALAFLCTYSSLRLVANYQWHNQHQLVIYQVPGHHAIDIVQGKQSSFIGDSAMAELGFLQRFHLLPGRVAMQSFPSSNQILNGHGFYTFSYNNQSFLILDKSPDYTYLKQHTFDYLIPGAKLSSKPIQLLQNIKVKNVILDGTIPNYAKAKWHNAADSLHLRIHDMAIDGAFVLKHNPF